MSEIEPSCNINPNCETFCPIKLANVAVINTIIYHRNLNPSQKSQLLINPQIAMDIWANVVIACEGPIEESEGYKSCRMEEAYDRAGDLIEGTLIPIEPSIKAEEENESIDISVTEALLNLVGELPKEVKKSQKNKSVIVYELESGAIVSVWMKPEVLSNKKDKKLEKKKKNKEI